MKKNYEKLMEEFAKGAEVLRLMEKLETPTKLSVLMTELDVMQEEDKDSFEIMLTFIKELANR